MRRCSAARLVAVSSVLAVALSAAVPGCKKRSPTQREAASAARDAPAPASNVAAPPLRPERIVVDRITLEVMSEDAADLDEALLAQVLAESMVATGWFASDVDAVPETHRGRHANLKVTLSHNVVSAVRVVVVAIEAQLSWADGGVDVAPSERLAADMPLGEGDQGESVAGIVAVALRDVGATLGAKEKIRSGGSEALLEALAVTGGDVELQLWALEVARENHRTDAYDGVVAMLETPDRRVRGAAIGALTAFGDSRAVKAIARTTDTTDMPSVLLSIEAASQLGGDEALSYLEFLVRGHSDEGVREAAGNALERIRPPVR